MPVGSAGDGGWRRNYSLPSRCGLPASAQGTDMTGEIGVQRWHRADRGRRLTPLRRRACRPATRVARRRPEHAPMSLPEPVRHISVLGREAVDWLAPRAGGVYVDATFGAGGYSRAILTVDGTRVIGIDRDRTAIAGGFDLVEQSDGRLTLVESRFSQLAEVCASQGVGQVDGVVMDVGVSSMQLDQAERGFSFRFDGPLDMRMGHDGFSAAEVIAAASEADLANIFYIFGEERHSRAVARAIVAARARGADRHHQGTGRSRLKGGAQQARRDPSGDAQLSGRCASSSTPNSTSCIWRCRRRARAEAGRTPRGGVVSFAGRPHRQEFLRRARQGRAAARGIGRTSRRRRRVSGF